MKFQTNYDKNVPVKSRQFAKVGRTKSEFKESCDINHIMSKYLKSGICYGHQPGDLYYGDFSSGFDFQTAQNVIARATQQFEALPSHVRSEFNNDPYQFLEYCEDEDNRQDLIDAGILPKPVTEPTGDVDPQPPEAADAPPAGGE